jgi:hypothetical protein
VDARVDDYQPTPLMIAARRMLSTAVRILIDAGGDVNLKDLGQQTALDRAREARDDRGAVNAEVVAAVARGRPALQRCAVSRLRRCGGVWLGHPAHGSPEVLDQHQVRSTVHESAVEKRATVR